MMLIHCTRDIDKLLENTTKVSLIFRARYCSDNHRVFDRHDRFVEAQTTIIPVLCPAETLNSGSRQRRSIITRKKSNGGGDGEKKVV